MGSGPSDKSFNEAQAGGHDPGGAIGRCSDDPATGGIFFVDGEGVEHDPIKGAERISESSFVLLHQGLVQGRGAAADLHWTIEFAGSPASTVDAVVHGLLDRLDPGLDLIRRPPCVFVGDYNLCDALAGGSGNFKQLLAVLEWILDGHRVLDQLVVLRSLFADYEASTDGVELLDKQAFIAVAENREPHPVGVERQEFLTLEEDVAVVVETNRPLARQNQLFRIQYALEEGVLLIGIDRFGRLALEAPDDRPVGVVTSSR